jgi:hypothetical protein
VTHSGQRAARRPVFPADRLLALLRCGLVRPRSSCSRAFTKESARRPPRLLLPAKPQGAYRRRIAPGLGSAATRFVWLRSPRSRDCTLLIARGQRRLLLKMNPSSPILGPVPEEVFAPFVPRAGYLRRGLRRRPTIGRVFLTSHAPPPLHPRPHPQASRPSHHRKRLKATTRSSSGWGKDGR